ncbi:MAG: hypothetical protein AABX37_06175, partial [Nanoarchaeota archaeon]
MMKFTPGLLHKKLSQWKGKQWYHQRFDGSPYLLQLVGEGEILEERRKLGCHNYVHYCWFEKGKADWYIEWGDIKRIYTTIIEAGKKYPNISKTLMKNWKNDEEAFYDACKKVEATDLTKLGEEELLSLHDWFVDIVITRNSSSSIIDGFALGTDTIIAEMIKKAYEASDLPKTVKFTEVFSLLTAPVHLSFINEAEVALLKVAVAVKKDHLFREKLLEEHQKKYFWIHNNYIDAHVLEVQYFNEELEQLLSLNIDLNEEITKIEQTPTINKQEKKELMKKLPLTNELKMLLEVSEDFTHWQDERKRATFWTSYYATLILDEIGRRVHIPSRLIKFASPREIAMVLAGRLSKEELEQRYENCVFYWDIEGHDCVTGKEADTVRDAILDKIDFSDVDDFRGLTASMGRVMGTVKVLHSATEAYKVEKGDISREDYEKFVEE